MNKYIIAHVAPKPDPSNSDKHALNHIPNTPKHNPTRANLKSQFIHMKS